MFYSMLTINCTILEILLLISIVNGGCLTHPTPHCLNNMISSIHYATKGVVEAVPEIFNDRNHSIPVPSKKLVPELIEEEGYPSQNHYVTTRDGYILNIHRIPFGRTGKTTGKVVYIQHGLLLASSDWVLMGRNQGLAYLLADAGYDVWLGNARGNVYSRNHTILSPDSKEFWDFSWHEIGIIDVPTIIDYILETTGQSNLFHIGHSQGTTSFYVMVSERPEYNYKVKAHISLAPVAFMEHMFSPLLRFASLGTGPMNILMQQGGHFEFLSENRIFTPLFHRMCTKRGMAICKNALYLLTGFSPKQLNVSAIPLLTMHYPAGAATKQIIHYGQEVRSGKFRQFDYEILNLKKYGRLTPPDYKLWNIIAPVHLMYSKNDWMAAPIDVKRLAKILPNCQELYEIPIETWSHLDFVFGNDAPEFVYQKVLDILSKY